MDGHHSVNSIAKKYSLSWATIKDWLRKYKDDGIDGLKKSTTWKRYESDLKQKAVLAIINDKMSLRQATVFFQLSLPTILRKWISRYTNGEALKDNRGRNRSSEFLTEEERLKLRVKELESRNRHLEMENDFAKKLQEIQQQNHSLR